MAAETRSRELGWDAVLKSCRRSERDRPDMARAWRNIDGPSELKEAWQTLGMLAADGGSGDFMVQKSAPAGVPIAVRSFEDSLFGPVVSFGIAGPIVELLGDWAYRIPPLEQRDLSAMVREVKCRRCCSATAAPNRSTSMPSRG